MGKAKRGNQTLLLVIIVAGLFVLVMNNPDLTGEFFKKGPKTYIPSKYGLQQFFKYGGGDNRGMCTPSCMQDHNCPDGTTTLGRCEGQKPKETCENREVECVIYT